jgi:hypothetical protein
MSSVEASGSGADDGYTEGTSGGSGGAVRISRGGLYNSYRGVEGSGLRGGVEAIVESRGRPDRLRSRRDTQEASSAVCADVSRSGQSREEHGEVVRGRAVAAQEPVDD